MTTMADLLSTHTSQSQMSSFFIDKMRIVSVVSYGAKGNGVADDTNAIQSAIDAVDSAGGGIVCIPEGTYLISSTINLKNGVSIYGAGSGSAFREVNDKEISVIKWTDASGGIMILGPDNWTGQLRNFLIDGDYLATNCLKLVSPCGGYFENLNIIHGRAGNSEALLIDNAGGTSTAVLNTFHRVFVYSTAYIALSLKGTSSAQITLNTFVGCRFRGDYISIRCVQYVDNNVWIGGRIEAASSGYGVILAETAKEGVYSNFFYGIPIDASSDGTATGVLCKKADVQHIFQNVAFGGTWGTRYNLATSDAKIKFIDCQGLAGGSGGNPYVALAAIPVSASPFTYTNTNPYVVDVTVSGGTVSDIAFVRNSVETSLGLTSGAFRLQVGDGLKVTYTGAPTMIKIPH